MTSNQLPPTNRLSRRSILGFLGAASAAVASGGALTFAQVSDTSPERCSPPPGLIPPGLRPGGAYDLFLQQQAEEDQFSGNVLLAHDGREVLARSSGMADKARSIPNSPNTLFALASVTKSMTATAILQLAQAGKIALEATLGNFVSGFPSQIADTVTVHQLLTMTSGMDNYYFDPAWFPQSKQWSTPSEVLDGTLAFIRQQPLRFIPGTQYYYSDSGFVVLGAIVAQVAGQAYWDYMRQHIFDKAGMGRTDFYTRPQVLALLATGELAHSYGTPRGGGPRVDMSGHPMFIGLPDGAGGPYTTAPDMLAFAMALQNSTLLDSAYAQFLLNGKAPLSLKDGFGLPTDTVQAWYTGYGLEDFVVNNKHILAHSGNGPASRQTWTFIPDSNG
jgi:CubicO group peptidase (beta-lactamase class C family)